MRTERQLSWPKSPSHQVPWISWDAGSSWSETAIQSSRLPRVLISSFGPRASWCEISFSGACYRPWEGMVREEELTSSQSSRTLGGLLCPFSGRCPANLAPFQNLSSVQLLCRFTTSWGRFVSFKILFMYLFLASVGPCCGAQALGCTGFSSCSSQAPSTGSRVVAHGWVASWNVGSFQIRAGICVSCSGRRILSHRAPREAPGHFILW